MTLFTVGHSTRSLAQLVSLLAAHAVETLVDVRRFPASRRHPQVNREALEGALPAAGIEYAWLEGLGGRRSRRKGSDWLTVRGVEVLHIMSDTRVVPHTVPPFLRVVDGRLVYDGGQLPLV